MSDVQTEKPLAGRFGRRSHLLVDDLHRVLGAAPPVEVVRRMRQFIRWFLLPDGHGSWFDTEARVRSDGAVEYERVPWRAVRWTACFLVGLVVAAFAIPGPLTATRMLVAERARANAERHGWRAVALPELRRNLEAVRNATAVAIENPALPIPERAAAVETLVQSLAHFERWEELADLDRRYIGIAPDVAPAVVAAAERVDPSTATRVVRELITTLAPAPGEVPSLGYVSLLMLDGRWRDVDQTLANRRSILAGQDPPQADLDGLLLWIASMHMRPDAEFRTGPLDAPSERYRRLDALWFEYSSEPDSDPFLYALWLHADGRVETALAEYDRLSAEDDRALLGAIYARTELVRFGSRWLDEALEVARGPGRERLPDGAAIEEELVGLRQALEERAATGRVVAARQLGRSPVTVDVRVPPQLLRYLRTDTLVPRSVGDWPLAEMTTRRPGGGT